VREKECKCLVYHLFAFLCVLFPLCVSVVLPGLSALQGG
jgi:hypothetical protein